MKTCQFLAICPSAISRALGGSHETLGKAKTISISYAFACFAWFPTPSGAGNEVVCKIQEIPKNLPSRKSATRRTYKTKKTPLRGARLRRRGAAAAFRHEFLTCFLSIFSGEAATLKNQWFPTGSTPRKPSGGRLAAFWVRAGGALGALWRRSRGVLGRARPCRPPELTFRPGPLALRWPRSLPPGCRCDDLAPRRPAGPASSQAARRQSLLGKTKSYTS